MVSAPMVSGSVSIIIRIDLSPRDYGRFDDVDELALLSGVTTSHGLDLTFLNDLDPHVKQAEAPIGVLDSDWSSPSRLTFRLDSYAQPHIIGTPGIQTLLVMADTLRLMGVLAPRRIDVECFQRYSRDWDLIDADPRKAQCTLDRALRSTTFTGHIPQFRDDMLAWTMPDDISALGWMFDLVTYLQGHPPTHIHATPGSTQLCPW